MIESERYRYRNIDMARALAVLFMIMVHCLENFGTPGMDEQTGYGVVTEFFGSFTSATVFMFVLGMGIHFTQDKRPSKFIRRGVMLLGAGYLLNVLRGFLPMLVTWQITGDSEWVPDMMMELFWIDILQFAGLAFLFFGLMKRVGAGTRGYLIALVLFQILNYILLTNAPYFSDTMNYGDPKYYLSAITGLFWGSGEFSSFPFLTWIFYPLAGYLFGTYLISKAPEKQTRVYLIGLCWSAAIGIATYFVCWYYEIDFGWDTDASFYHHWLPGNLIFGSCAFALIAVISLLYKFIPKFIENIMTRWSKNVTKIYVVQWILIGWVAVVTDYNTMGLSGTIILTIGIAVASDALAFLWAKNKRNHRIKEESNGQV